jgi:hypothetical protein
VAGSLLNYTTKIEAAQTAAEIMGVLSKVGTRGASIDYDPDGVPVALAFAIEAPHGEMAFRLPSRWEGVHAVLTRDWEQRRIEGKYASKLQAKRVAWRILKDWCEAQVALIQVGMVKTEEVFLPYALTANRQTFFEAYVDQQKALPPGKRGAR